MTQTLALVNAFDAFIKGCKTDGTWGAIKASCILAGWNNLDGALTPLVGAAPTNFNFGSVSLLLRGDGPNGSTNIADSSLLANTVAATGNAQLSTAQSRFGGSSISLPDTTSFVNAPTLGGEYSFGSGNFTVEFFGYFTHPAGQFRRWVVLAGTGVELVIRQESTNQYSFFFIINGVLSGPFLGGTVTQSAWTHIALVRNGSNWNLYVNGTSTISRTGSETFPPFNNVSLGGFSGEHGTGFYDDLRITKGAALYTANFTPPTQTLPATGDYNRETGLVGDGSTKYLDTNSSPTAAPETLTNFAYAVYCSALPTNGVDSAFIGCRGNTGNDLYQLHRDASNLLSSYNKVGLPVARSQTTGFIGSARSGTAESLRSGGASTTATSTATSSFSSQTNVGVYSFREVNGSRVNVSNARISFYLQAGFLNLALLDARVTALINAIAAAIP
jgi:hypothetical protein